jgi:hypothetical protein
MLNRRVSRGRVVVAIPARDEAEEIGGCLLALAGQRHPAIDTVVICLNNCSDSSAELVRSLGQRLPFAVHSLVVQLPDAVACAGRARRIAMERGGALAGMDGVLLTTDADARVGPHWVADNLAALSAGADAVAGRAKIEPEGARHIPAHLQAIDARECAFAALLDEIAAVVDPDPADPWPRHDEHTGASIAVSVEAYRRAGRMPVAPLGEDRAFFAALRLVDARIRHEPGIAVTVSARTIGRARGGMADTIRRRMERPDPFLDDRLEPACDRLRRLRLRRALRVQWTRDADATTCSTLRSLATRLDVPEACLVGLLRARHFGAAWAEIEAASPRLCVTVPVKLEELAAETARAERIRDSVRRATARASAPLAIAAE